MANPKKTVVKTTTKKTSVPQFQPLTNGKQSAYSNAINFTPNDALSYTAGVGMPVQVDFGNGMTTTSYGQQFGNAVSPFDAYKTKVANDTYQSFNGGDEGDFDYSSIGDNLNPASIDLAEMPNLPTNSNSFNWGPLSGSGTAIKNFVGTDAFKNTASALFQGLGYMNSRSSLKETKANNAYNRDMMNKQYGQFIDDKAGLSAIDWTSRDTSPQAQVDYNARKAAETTRLQNIK